MKTIVAISSPVGAGGIGIVRMSGDDVVSIAGKVFQTKNNINYDVYPMMMHFGTFIGLDFKDKGYLVYFPKEKAFTGEPTVEFYLHGGVRIMKGAVDRIIKEGARMAQPGEFTKRAYVNGRMTLSDAEGVSEMITSQSAAGLRAAYRLMTGMVGKKIDEISSRLTDLISALEASLDYPEEMEDEVLPAIRTEVPAISQSVKELISSARSGRMARDGILVAIAGHVNAGKSSLLNALLGQDRAIVTDIPGTTRDTIEASLEVDGVLVNLVDTAGIRETNEKVEGIGVERAKQTIENADLVLYVIDSTDNTSFPELEKLLKDKKVFRIYNKMDSPQCLEVPEAEYNVFHISAKTGEGIIPLKHAIVSLYTEGLVDGGEIITSQRHLDALKRTEENLESALNNINSTIDCILVDLRNALECLGEINGKSATEYVVDGIFKNFCVGK